MRERLDKWLSRLYHSVGLLYYVSHWVTLAGVLGFLGSLGASKWLHVGSVWLSGGVSAAAMFIGLLLMAKRRTARLHGNNQDIYIELLESFYSELGDSRYRYTRRLIIKALRKGVDHYSYKFGWSGTGSIAPKVESSPDVRVKVEIVDEPFGSRKVCLVQFQRPLRKGQRIEFTYSLDMEDRGHTARPFLTHRVKEPLGRLVLRTKVLDASAKDFLKLVFDLNDTDIPTREEKALLKMGSDEMEWEISRPRLRSVYQLRWMSRERL